MRDAYQWREIMGYYPGGTEGVLAYNQADSGPPEEGIYLRRNFHGNFAGSPRPRKHPRKSYGHDHTHSSNSSPVTQWHRSKQIQFSQYSDAVGPGLWTVNKPPAWGPDLADTFPVRRYAAEVGKLKGTGRERLPPLPKA